MHENEISYLIRACIFKIYNKLGPGLLESAYESALVFEIKKAGLAVKTQVGMPMVYETIKAEMGYRMDIVVEGKVIVELKSVENLAEVSVFRKVNGL